MPNKNYLNGAARERRIMRRLEEQGYICLRCRGSHGFADIVAINRNNKTIRFVQSKPKKFSKKETARLLLEHSWINDKYLCSFEITSLISKARNALKEDCRNE